jgi:hypothetical protein
MGRKVPFDIPPQLNRLLIRNRIEIYDYRKFEPVVGRVSKIRKLKLGLHKYEKMKN